MARLKLCGEDSKNQDVLEIFDEIRERAGRVPAAYRAFALHPHILQANWNRTKNILGQGNLPIEIKEAIATRVSKVNGCHFCLKIHKDNLEALGLDSASVESIENGCPDDEKLHFILAFVATATKEPDKLTNADFEQLKAFGYSEKDILEILTTMEMYTGYNKIIVALGLQDDD
ncbi:MAG: peroxidase-related enzyme [Alphaproteobacteria bacterium]|nr:peroxidase-related enzyme [Alphaproteobacteria bacterium]